MECESSFWRCYLLSASVCKTVELSNPLWQVDSDPKPYEMDVFLLMVMTRGVYVLVISVGKNISIQIGALGVRNLKKGLYAYVGSAQGNLERRIRRHVGRVKRKFWHIDYLLASGAVQVTDVFTKERGREEECMIAKELCARAVPIEGFGSSDCKCTSHLFKLGNLTFLEECMQRTRTQ